MENERTDDITRLVDFLRDRDVRCPLCGYNLRNLTAAFCPECRQPLKLTVGAYELKMGWFIAAIIPGAFSGIAAFLLMLPLVLVPLLQGPPAAPPHIYFIDGFGWLSGVFCLGLIHWRLVFLRQRTEVQQVWSCVIWAVHLATFMVLLWYIFYG